MLMEKRYTPSIEISEKVEVTHQFGKVSAAHRNSTMISKQKCNHEAIKLFDFTKISYHSFSDKYSKWTLIHLTEVES